MGVEQETAHYRRQSVALTDGQGIPDHVDMPSEQYQCYCSYDTPSVG